MYLEDYDLSGKKAVVTGGGRGIGAAICQALAEAGAEIVILDLNEEAASTSAKALLDSGRTASYYVVDVTDASAVNEVADALNRDGQAIDILVNNAGVARISDSLDGPDEDWILTMKVNSDAAYWCSRAFGRHMVERRRGSVVNIGSMCGSIVTRPQNSIPYMASKGAIHMMTKALACAWATRGVRVNAVAPGYVRTEMTGPLAATHPEWLSDWEDMTPMKRLAETREIAAAVLFLASGASSYCTGSILAVDGGFTSW